MKIKVTGFLSIIVLLLLCGQIEAGTYRQKNVPLEGELDTRDMRSIGGETTVTAFLDETELNIEFYKYIPEVTISIKDVNNTIIYTKTVASPRYEIISLEGIESGCYTLELSAETGYMHGTFMYVY